MWEPLVLLLGVGRPSPIVRYGREPTLAPVQDSENSVYRGYRRDHGADNDTTGIGTNCDDRSKDSV